MSLLHGSTERVHALEEANLGFALLLGRRLRAGAFDTRALNHDAKRQISGEVLEQPRLVGGERVGLGRVDAENPEGALAVVLQGQRNTRAIPSLERGLPPHRDLRVRGEVLTRDALAAPNGRSARAVPPLDIRPGEARLLEVPALGPGPRDRVYGLRVVGFGIAHPAHAVACLVTDDLTHVVDEALFVFGSNQDLVAAADGSELSIQSMQHCLGALALGDVDERDQHP